MTLNETAPANCPACQNPNGKVWMEDGKETRYVKCKKCGTVYASPKASYQSRFNWLNGTFGVGEEAFQNAVARLAALAEEAGIISKHVSGGRILDVGCDLGHLFQWFPSPAWERFGVEISPSAADYASRNYAAHVYAGTIRQAGNSEDYFDLVTMLDTLYYLDDPQEDFMEIYRILKHEGRLVIEITGLNYQLLRSRGILCWLVEGQWTRLRTDSSYINWMSPRGLNILLKNCGFEILDKYIVGSPCSMVKWRNFLLAMHLRLARILMRWSYPSLTWVPKYLILAKKSD